MHGEVSHGPMLGGVGKASLRQLGVHCFRAATWVDGHSPVPARHRVWCWQLPHSLYIS